MNLGTPGNPVEITKEDVIDKIVALGAILDEAAEPKPWYIRVNFERLLDKRQCRRLRRNMARKNGRRVACFSAEKAA